MSYQPPKLDAVGSVELMELDIPMRTFDPAPTADLGDFFKAEASSMPSIPAAGGVASTAASTAAISSFTQVSHTAGNQVPSSSASSSETTRFDPYLDSAPEFIRNAKHPFICIFHLIFKIACLALYLFSGYLWNNTLVTFILCIILLAVDFWTVKNVTGRKLVGLRWWHLSHVDSITQEEVSDWVFESNENERAIDPLDRNVFWMGLYGWALTWSLFMIINLLTFSLGWVVFLVVAQTFAWTNLIAFWKCSGQQREKTQSFVQESAARAVGFTMPSIAGFDLARLMGGGGAR